MRKIYRMALELLCAIGLAVPEMFLIWAGNEVYFGRLQLAPDSYFTMQQTEGLFLILLGFVLMNMLAMLMMTWGIQKWEKKIEKLEDEIHGMDEEAEEEN